MHLAASLVRKHIYISLFYILYFDVNCSVYYRKLQKPDVILHNGMIQVAHISELLHISPFVFKNKDFHIWKFEFAFTSCDF